MVRKHSADTSGDSSVKGPESSDSQASRLSSCAGFPAVQAFQACGLDGEPSVQAIAPENWNELEGIARSDGFMLWADDGEELGYSE